MVRGGVNGSPAHGLPEMLVETVVVVGRSGSKRLVK